MFYYTLYTICLFVLGFGENKCFYSNILLIVFKLKHSALEGETVEFAETSVIECARAKHWGTALILWWIDACPSTKTSDYFTWKGF